MTWKESKGVTLGHPKGPKSSKVKHFNKEAAIQILLDDGMPKIRIAKIFKVDRMTLDYFILSRKTEHMNWHENS